MMLHYDRMPHFSGSNHTPDDLLLTATQEQQLLSSEVYVQEKLDGIGVTILCQRRHRLVWGVRPKWMGVLEGAVERGLGIYVQQHRRALLALLHPGMTLYGEWLWHRLSIGYDALPDLLMCYGLRLPSGEILSPEETKRRIEEVELSYPPYQWQGVLGTKERLLSFVGRSAYGQEEMEGVVVHLCGQVSWPYAAKWVAPSYQRPKARELGGQRNTLSLEATARVVR